MLTRGNLALAADAATRVTAENLRALGLDLETSGAISPLPLAHASA